MKRFALIFVSLLIGYAASAQYVSTPEIQTETSQICDETVTPNADSGDIVPGMKLKYREIKKFYDYRDYRKEPGQRYRPGGLGVASFFIPGLGEMIAGEGWRGAAFMGGWLAAHFVALTGVFELSDAIYYTGIAGALTMRVWSTADAVRVAKVKNLYYRDLMGPRGLEVDLYPSMSYIKTAERIQPTTGFTLAFRF